jgi:tetratricopeptide (TPR) repeat protein
MRQNPNPIIAKASENLAMIYTMQGNYDQAISYFSEGLRLKSMIYGINSVETARAYLNIANFYITLSNYDEAQNNLLRAENIFINNFGPSYKDLADVYLNLGEFMSVVKS